MMGHADWTELKIYPDGHVKIYEEDSTESTSTTKFSSQDEALKYYKKLGYYEY